MNHTAHLPQSTLYKDQNQNQNLHTPKPEARRNKNIINLLTYNSPTTSKCRHHIQEFSFACSCCLSLPVFCTQKQPWSLHRFMMKAPLTVMLYTNRINLFMY